MLVFSKIRTEQNLDKIGIPNKYASAIDSELASNGWMTLTKSGPILNPSGRAHLAKLELSNPKQPHERSLEFLKPHWYWVICKYQPNTIRNVFRN